MQDPSVSTDLVDERQSRHLFYVQIGHLVEPRVTVSMLDESRVLMGTGKRIR